MKRTVYGCVLAALLACGLRGTAQIPSTQPAPDASKLFAMEASKWNPASLGDPKALLAMFADDFVSVEYGADVSGGVRRKTRAEVFSGPPLPPAKFALSEWQAINASPDVIVVSYLVTGETFTWRAYATSVWARRKGDWKTVFYQASTAR